MTMTARLSEKEALSLLQQEEAALKRLLGRMVRQPDVDDLFQEVSVKALGGRDAFRGESGAVAWLHRIAKNAALDHLKSRRHRQARRTDALEEVEEVEPLSEQAVGAKRLVAGEMNGCIRDYVSKLPAPQREILELKDLKGMTSAGVAKHLGISLDAAKIRLHRARAALRRELEKGCEFYQSDTGTLACDRRTMMSVSLDSENSSESVPPEKGARRSDALRRKSKNTNIMSSTSSCGCSSNDCAAPAAASSAHSTFSAIAAEYVALGAAIGANCEPCLRYHVRESLKVGISKEDIAQAIAQAERVKATPAENMRKLAQRLIIGDEAAVAGQENSGCGC